VLAEVAEVGGEIETDAAPTPHRWSKRWRSAPLASTSTSTKSASAGLCWNDLDRDLRERLSRDAGLPIAVASLAAAEISLVEQSLMTWTQEELAQTRILFAPAGSA
jgi:hypothetical protein